MRNLRSTSSVLVLALALAATVGRAARFPNDFAEAHWMLDYRYGFIKRALVGSMFDFLAELRVVPHTTGTIAAFSFVVFALFCLMLLIVAARIMSASSWNPGTYLALAAFLTSPYIVTAAHLMGYFDHIVILLTFGAMWLMLRDRVWAAGGMSAVAALVHESFMLIGLPLLALAALMQRPGSRQTIGRRLIPLALPLGVFAAVALSETFVIDREYVRGHLVRHLTRFHFIGSDMNLFVPEWLTTTLSQNLREQAHAFRARIADPGFLRLILPTAAVLWLLALTALERHRRAAWALLFAVAVAAPLLQHLVAWDTARVWSYPIVVAFGCAWMCAETGASGPRGNAVVGLLASAAIAWNMFVRYPLLDGEVERFSAAQRLILYAPFVAGTVFLSWRRRK